MTTTAHNHGITRLTRAQADALEEPGVPHDVAFCNHGRRCLEFNGIRPGRTKWFASLDYQARIGSDRKTVTRQLRLCGTCGQRFHDRLGADS